MRGAAIERLERRKQTDNNNGDAGYGCACKSSAQESNQLAAAAAATTGRQPIIVKPQVGALAPAAASISTRTAGKHMTTFKGNDANDISINSSGISCNDLERFLNSSSHQSLLAPKLAPKPKQTQTQTTTAAAVAAGRNSLESINSKLSISSANDDSQPQPPSLIEQPLQFERQKQQPDQQRWPIYVASSASTSSSSAAADCQQPSSPAIVGGDGSPTESTLVVSSPDGPRRNSQSTRQPSVPLRASHSIAVRYFSPPNVPCCKEQAKDCDVASRPELDWSKGRHQLVLAAMEQGDQQRQKQMNITTTRTNAMSTQTIIQSKSTIGQQQEGICGEQRYDKSAGQQQSAANKSTKNLAPLPPAQQMISLAEKSAEAGEALPPAPVMMDGVINLPTPEETAPSGPPFVFAGIAASIAASAFFSISILCIKLLPDSEGLTEKAMALFFRGLFMMILCGFTIITTKGTFILHRDELWVNIARACFGTTGVFGSFCALKYISIGDSTALVFSSPIWTSILGHFILKEPLQWLQILALPVSLFGIVLIAHPTLIVSADLLSPVINQPMILKIPPANITASPLVVSARLDNSSPPVFVDDHDQNLELLQLTTNIAGVASRAADGNSMITNESSFDFEHRWPGIVIALLTSLIVSCIYIVLKFRKKTPIQTTTFWFGFAMLVAALALMSAIGFGDFPPSTWWVWSLLLGNGVCSWIGQTLLQWALLYEEAGTLSIVRTLDVAMTFILSALFLDDDIYWTSIVGATLIGLVVVSIMLSSWIRSLSIGCMSSHRKQDFSFNDNSGSDCCSSCKGPHYPHVHKSSHEQRTKKDKRMMEKYSQSRGGSNGIIAPQNAPKTISDLVGSNKQQQHDSHVREPHYARA